MIFEIINYFKRKNKFNWYDMKVNKKYYIINIFTKYYFLLIIFFTLIFYKHIYTKNQKIKLDIDNLFELSLYENNIIFSNYSTELKPIALYYPELINFTYFNNILKFVNISIDEVISKQVDLARNHGIYGFAINYVYSYDEKIYNNVFNIFLNNKKINFPFLLNWKNDNFNLLNNIDLELINFIKNIKKFLISKNYIKINNKPLISIGNPLIFQNLNEVLLLLRNVCKKNEIGEIFLIFPYNSSINEIKHIELFDGAFDYSKLDPFKKNNKNQKIFYYAGIIYKNMILNDINNLKNKQIYKTSILEIPSNNLKNYLRNFTLEKFYILNNIITDWTEKNLNNSNKLFFINSWNNYLEGNYLEPDEIYGYASINSFSKALFKLPLKEKIYQLLNFKNKTIVAIQVHIYYEDLIDDILNKTNNIPVNFDLFLSITSKNQKKIIEERILKNSKANKYEIKIFQNKGRDVLPFIRQMKFNIKKYKYVCHLHTKKSKHDTFLGSHWRNYLYANLLGNKEIISEILTDFEKYDKLGFIFPEVYYDIIKDIDNYDSTEFPLHKPNIKHMNFILKKIFPGFQIGEKLIFPTGDMFWAKTNAIHQIFKIRLKKKFPQELNQTNETIMHGIERLWLYLVKLNGYYFRVIFKHF